MWAETAAPVAAEGSRKGFQGSCSAGGPGASLLGGGGQNSYLRGLK